MKLYKVSAVDDRGKRVTETIACEEEQEIFDLIKEKSLFLVHYRQIRRPTKSKLSTKDLIIFTRQLSTMIVAGLSIIKAIAIIQDRTTQSATKKIYRNLSQEIQRGNTLSIAMKKQGGVFPDILINMVEAGEIGGTLDRSLSLMAKHFDKEMKLQNKVKSASTYPIILAVISILVVVILVTFVLPGITKTLPSQDMPFLTKMLMGLSHFLTSRWYLIIAFFFLLATFVSFLLTIPEVKLFYDKMTLYIPVIGKLNRTIYSARCARSFASLYLSGIQTLAMIEATGRILNNSYIESLFGDVVARVAQGEFISESIDRIGVFDPMLASMINVGEETGSLGEILVSTAEYFDEEADVAMGKMVALLEPAMLVTMGVVIGIIVIAIMQPMFAVYKTVG